MNKHFWFTLSVVDELLTYLKVNLEYCNITLENMREPYIVFLIEKAKNKVNDLKKVLEKC